MKKVLIPTKLDSLATKILADHGGYEVVQEPKTPILDLAKRPPSSTSPRPIRTPTRSSSAPRRSPPR